jgi:LacI family transcriptional regulator
VADETKKKVLTAIEELGYKPHAIARSLRTGSTLTVGVLVPNVVAGYFGHLVTDLELQLAERGYSVLLANSQENRERERHMLDLLAERSIDGLLHAPISHKNASGVEQLISNGIPVVFIDRFTPEVQADVVMTDNIDAARQITRDLALSGCRRIICITFHDEASSAIDRVTGYRQAMAEFDLPVDESSILLVRWPFGDRVETLLQSHFDTYGIPDGILCTVEGFLAGTIQVLRKQGDRVLDHVKVAGGFTASFSPWQELLDKPLLIARQRTEIMAQRAVELLMHRLDGDTSPCRTEMIKAEIHHQSSPISQGLEGGRREERAE